MEELSVDERISLAVLKLPTLDGQHVPSEDSCPICLVPFASILDGSVQEEGVITLGERDVSLGGITKLEGCGHIFCRVDLIEWIRGRHGTCPTCRNHFLDITPSTDSDGESSDGDYIPNEDDEEDEEDGFLDTDGFTDVEDFDMEIDVDLESWGDMGADFGDYYEMDEEFNVDVNLGLSDGDGSASLSEGEVATSGEEDPSSADGATVYSASEEPFPGEETGNDEGK